MPPVPLRVHSPVPEVGAQWAGRAARRAAPARLAEHQVPVGGHEQVALQAARDARREGVAQRAAGRHVARPASGRASPHSRARPAAVPGPCGARRTVRAGVWRARAAAGQRGVHEQVARQQDGQAAGIDGHLANERGAGERRAAAAGQVLHDHAGQRVPARAAAPRA